MKVAPTGIAPPWPYEASSGVLNRLSRPVTGPEFIQRVRRFSRIGILTLGTRFLWHTWNHDETLKPDTPEAIGHRLTMTYAERVMALAAIYSNDHQRPDPTEVDFRLLCWELHNGSDGQIIVAATIDELARRLETVGADSLLRNISPDNARTLLAEAFKARLAALQHVGRYFEPSHFARGYLIARQFAERASRLGGAEYDRAERHFFLTSLAGFFKAAWALFYKAQIGLAVHDESGRTIMTDFGHIYARDWPSDPKLEDLHIGAHDLRAVASVLSEPLSGYKEHRATFRNADTSTLKYDSRLDRLLLRPLIDTEHGGRCEHVVVPSPWRYVHAVPDFVFYDFVRFLQERRVTTLAGRDAYSLRGEAFADYVRAALIGVRGVYDLDEEPELAGEKRPDLLCVGSAHTVLVELKFSLKPNEDRILKDNSAAVEAWRRAAEAIAQAKGLLAKHSPLLRARFGIKGPVVLAIVSTDPLIDESIGFRAIAKAGSLLAGSGLGAIVMLPTAELERWLLLSDADSLARESLIAWERLDPTMLSQDSGVRAPKAEGDFPHIAAGWKELFPFYGQKTQLDPA